MGRACWHRARAQTDRPLRSYWTVSRTQECLHAVTIWDCCYYLDILSADLACKECAPHRWPMFIDMLFHYEIVWGSHFNHHSHQHVINSVSNHLQACALNIRSERYHVDKYLPQLFCLRTVFASLLLDVMNLTVWNCCFWFGLFKLENNCKKLVSSGEVLLETDIKECSFKKRKRDWQRLRWGRGKRVICTILLSVNNL